MSCDLPNSTHLDSTHLEQSYCSSSGMSDGFKALNCSNGVGRSSATGCIATELSYCACFALPLRDERPGSQSTVRERRNSSGLHEAAPTAG